MDTDNPAEYFQPFSFNTVTDELKKIAEIELNEKESEIQGALDTFKELLRKEDNLNPCLDDKFLIIFLRARKFNCDASLNLVKKYYSARIKYPSMFRNFTPKSCLTVLKANLHYFLPYRSPDGCAILLSKFGLWDPKKITCAELLKFNLMCNEMAMQNPVTQICGVITIADMKDFSWSHLLQIPVGDVKCFVNTLQDCLPIRDKAIHIINHSSIFSLLFAIVKPLLSEKVTKRIYFHGDDVSSLHQHLPPEILPNDLGVFQQQILQILAGIRQEQRVFIENVTSKLMTGALTKNRTLSKTVQKNHRVSKVASKNKALKNVPNNHRVPKVVTKERVSKVVPNNHRISKVVSKNRPISRIVTKRPRVLKAGASNHSISIIDSENYPVSNAISDDCSDSRLLPSFPIDTPSALTALDRCLSEKEFFNRTCKLFQSVGGRTPTETIKKILLSFMTNSLCTQYNWTGMRLKNSFGQLKNVVNFIKSCVHLNPDCKKVTDGEILLFLKKWLQHAKDRDGSRKIIRRKIMKAKILKHQKKN